MTFRQTLARHLGLDLTPPTMPEGCTDMESYATGFNDGFEAAMSQDFMSGDQMDPRDWLNGRLARERVQVLEDAAGRFPDTIDDPDQVPVWLRMLAEQHVLIDAKPEPVAGNIDMAVEPIVQALTEFRTRSRTMGGAASDCYANAASLVESALTQMGVEVRRG